MNVSTNIITKGSFGEKAKRSDVIWHGSYDSQFGVGGHATIGHGISRNMIGHQISIGAVASVNNLEVTSEESLLCGTILFLA